MAEQSQIGSQRNRRIIGQFPEPRSVRDRVLLPAEQSGNVIARFEARIARLFDNPDCAAAHDIAELDGRQVGIDFIRPAAVGRIKREVLVVNKKLALFQRGHRLLGPLEIAVLERAHGPRRESPLPIHSLCHSRPPVCAEVLYSYDLLRVFDLNTGAVKRLHNSTNKPVSRHVTSHRFLHIVSAVQIC